MPDRAPKNITLRLGVNHSTLAGDLVIPANAHGLIVFAHGSGSSRNSPRNRAVATELQRAGLATLLFDLLTPQEDERYENRFDIELLARRLVIVTKRMMEHSDTAGLPVGFFGASTGAAAALQAAAEMGDAIHAVVSRGGRPDLAIPFLSRVEAPTLLIVGEHDTDVIALNREAFRHLHCDCKIVLVPGATHLFEEPGTLEQVARLAREWFKEHVGAVGVHGVR